MLEDSSTCSLLPEAIYFTPLKPIQKSIYLCCCHHPMVCMKLASHVCSNIHATSFPLFILQLLAQSHCRWQLLRMPRKWWDFTVGLRILQSTHLNGLGHPLNSKQRPMHLNGRKFLRNLGKPSSSRKRAVITIHPPSLQNTACTLCSE